MNSIITNHREQFGPVTVSYATGSGAYCAPRRGGLALRAYESVEIGLLVGGELCAPSAAGVEGFDELFESGRSPVAGYVAWADVERLRAALCAKHGGDLAASPEALP